jgi:hypothetical protein
MTKKDDGSTLLLDVNLWPARVSLPVSDHVIYRQHGGRR